MSADIQKLTELMVAIGKEVEPKLPEGYTFALFVYERNPAGPVAAISKDRDRCAQAVATWLVQHMAGPGKEGQPS